MFTRLLPTPLTQENQGKGESSYGSVGIISGITVSLGKILHFWHDHLVTAAGLWRQAGQCCATVCQVCCCEGTRQPVFSSLCLEHCWCLSVCRHTMAVPSQHCCHTRTFNFWTVPTVQDPVWWQPPFLSKNRCFLWLVRSKALILFLLNIFCDARKARFSAWPSETSVILPSISPYLHKGYTKKNT